MTKEEIVDLVDKTVERKFRELLDGGHRERVAAYRERIFGEGSDAARRCDLLARLVEAEVSDK